MNYDKQYSETSALFGNEPEPLLKQFEDQLPQDSPILDIGAGQGRNSLFLTKCGYAVHALEPSTVAANGLKLTANDSKLEVFTTTFERFIPPVKSYSGIMVFGLIPDLDWVAIHKLVEKINTWLGPNGALWITGFTTQDPAYDHYKASWTHMGKHSFQGPENQARTYLEPKQILELFPSYTVLHHWEGLGPEHQHGDGPFERHGKFEAVFRKD